MSFQRRIFWVLAASSMVLAVTSGSVAAAVISASDSTFGAVDGSFITRSVNVGPGSGNVLDVNIAVDFAKCDRTLAQPGDQTCPPLVPPDPPDASSGSEIVLTLTGPNSIEISLVIEDTFAFETNSARVVITFDDEAASLVGGTVLQSGTFRPVEALSGLDGVSADGTWTLRVEDTANGDALSYFGFVLTITTDTPDGGGTGIPLPATVMLLGVGLATAVVARRRRR